MIIKIYDEIKSSVVLHSIGGRQFERAAYFFAQIFLSVPVTYLLGSLY